MNAAETKFSMLYTAGDLRHNASTSALAIDGSNTVLFGNMLRTDIGTGQRQRTGDSIFAKWIKISIDVKSDVDNLNIRFFCLCVPQQEVNNATPAALWASNSGIGLNKNLDSINSDKYRIKFEKRAHMRRNVATATETKRFDFFIPINRKINYIADASGASAIPKHMQDCLSFACIPYQNITTSPGNVVGSYEMKVQFVYKDF